MEEQASEQQEGRIMNARHVSFFLASLSLFLKIYI